MKEKSIFLVSALRHDSCSAGSLRQFSTEKEAVEHAKYIIERRAEQGQPYIDFFVLKTVSKVGVVKPPVKIVRFK